MYRKSLWGILNTILLSIATSVYADFSAPSGWYVEGNVGKSKLENTNFSGSTSTSGIGASVDLGYKLIPYLGVEFGYNYYANTTVKSSGTTAGKSKNYSLDLAGKVIWPVESSGIEFFAKLGIDQVHSDISISNQAAADTVGLTSGNNSATGLYMGLGGQYNFMSESAIVLQWARAEGNNKTGTLDLYSIGLSYLFA